MQTRQAREWDSSAYHRVSGPQFSWGKKVFARVRVRGDETVLDAGCGTGRLTADLLENLPRGRVVGVDMSQNMLLAAREHLTPRFGNHVGFVVADLIALPFDGVFDGIFSTAAFHWVLDHDRLFRSLRRGLRPGGWLIAQCGGGPNLARLRDRVRGLNRSPTYAQFLGEFREPWEFSNAETAAERMKRAGFKDVETSTEPALTTFENAGAYKEFVSSVVLHRQLALLPSSELRQEFMEAIAREAAADDPPYSLDYWRLNLNGRA
jgi:trans-aconitate methyltransferase